MKPVERVKFLLQSSWLTKAAEKDFLREFEEAFEEELPNLIKKIEMEISWRQQFRAPREEIEALN